MKNSCRAFLKILVPLVCFSIQGWAQPVTLPQLPSPPATVSQTIGISTMTVSYSRPVVNKREIWGALVPYGWNVEKGFGTERPSPWRAGANENTVLTLTHDATVQGQQVPAGKYGLFFVINKDDTGEVILSKDFRSWGNYWYDPARDQMRAPIKLREIPHTETLTYNFINLEPQAAELVLQWEKKEFPVKIQFNVPAIVMANAEEELKGRAAFTPQGPISAANYALLNNVNHEKALGWINGALAQTKTFAAMRIKAGLLEQSGKKDEADKIMNEAMVIATENDVNNYGYALLAQGAHDKAIEVLTQNTVRYPKSANAWDSLGEAYAMKGDKANAIKNFRKSLSLNPPDNVKANSEKYLKQLGAM